MSYIFFGYLLVFLNARINGFDILPDFIGYLLIFAGINKLAARSRYFSKASFLALFMSVVSLGDLIHLETITVESELFMALLVAASVFFTVIPLYLMYFITKGVADLEWDAGKNLAADRLMQAWKMNVFVTLLLCILAVPLSGIFMMGSGMLVLITILTVCVLVVNIIWVACFYGCKKRYDTVDEDKMICSNHSNIRAIFPIMALLVCILIGGLTLLSYSDYAYVMREGIVYAEQSENYRISEYPVRDSDYVVIDWDNVEAVIGQEIYNDGQCVIYISEIVDDQNGGYDIFFKTKGDFGYWKGRIVTPLSHMGIQERWEDILLQGVYQNWPNDAVLQVIIGDNTYLSEKWCSRAQSIDKNGDEVGYPMFALEYYEYGKMILTDEIRQNNNKVSIRLIGLKEIIYERV